MEGRSLEVVGGVIRWDVMGKAVSIEIEPRSVAEPNVLSPSRHAYALERAVLLKLISTLNRYNLLVL